MSDTSPPLPPPQPTVIPVRPSLTLRLRNYLSEAGAWDKAREEALLKQCNEQVQAAAQAYIDTPPPPLNQMFDHLYETLPAAYFAQRAAILETGNGPDNPR